MTGCPDLYRSGYRPKGLSKRFEAESICCSGQGQAGDVMRSYGAAAEWGDPVEAVGFFDDDSGQLKAMTADYANGRRAEFRRLAREWRLTITRWEDAHV